MSSKKLLIVLLLILAFWKSIGAQGKLKSQTGTTIFAIEQMADKGYLGFGANGIVYRYTPEFQLFAQRSDAPANSLVSAYSDVLRLEDDGFLALGAAVLSDLTLSIFLNRYNRDGHLIWQKAYRTPDISLQNLNLDNCPDGGFAIASAEEVPSLMQEIPILWKFSENGDSLWKKSYPMLQANPTFQDFIPKADTGFVLLTWDAVLPDSSVALLTGIDKNGDLDWNLVFPNREYGLLRNSSENDVFFYFSSNDEVIGSPIFQKISLDGLKIDSTQLNLPTALWNRKGYSIKLDAKNNIYLSGIFAGALNYFGRFKPDATPIWLKDNFLPKLGSFYSFRLNDFGGFAAAGSYTNSSTEFFLLTTDSLGNFPTNQIKGRVAFDPTGTCTYNPGQQALSDWLVIVKNQNTNELLYGLTDNLGNYAIDCDTGAYDLMVQRKNRYWSVCQPLPISFTTSFDTLNQNIAVNAQIDCPLMSVELGTPYLRRCFDNTYFVHWCNQGTLPADTAWIEIELDSWMTLSQSDLPAQSLGGNVFRFDLGAVPIDTCGKFTFQVLLDSDCDSTILGQTHCVSAHIFPDSSCIPVSANWNGASVALEVQCVGDTLARFTIRNVGTGNMTEQLDYIIIEDVVLGKEGMFQLPAGSAQIVDYLASGTTLRMVAEQVNEHPGLSMPSVALEGCGSGVSGLTSLGFVNQFPENDGDPFIAIDCRENQGSYDPNDKLAFPKGMDNQHFIEPNTTIEYLIRFQNTGSDTAFTVLLRDTLSSWLDVSSLQEGVGSHPYVVSFPDTNVVQFRFDNIRLVDSTTNEPLSHGFLKFKINQLTDVPLGTLIHNEADIYFDFNAAIRTNQTEHLVDTGFILVHTQYVAKPQYEVLVYPNPMLETAVFLLKNTDHLKVGTLILVDASGRVVRQITVQNDRFFLERKELPDGLYFFKIQDNKGPILAAGKVLLE